jgi:hypothetical protein
MNQRERGVASVKDLESEQFIIGAPISDERKRAFFLDYLSNRPGAAAVESIFRRAGAFESQRDFQDAFAFGFSVLLMKGPFVEGSNWLAYHNWDLAVAAERYLLTQLDAMARESVGIPAMSVARTWPELLKGADELIEHLHSGNQPQRSAIIIAGPLMQDWAVEMRDLVTPRWELPDDVNQNWIVGAYRERLILNIRESPVSALYVTDVPRFAKITKFGEPSFSLEAIDEQRASELLDAHPTIVAVPEGRPDTRAERIRQLRLRVGLRLYESYKLELLDRSAIAGVEIEAG